MSVIKRNPVLPPSTYYEYQFCFHDMYFTSNMFQQGEFQLLLMNSLFTWTHIYPPDGYVPLQCLEFHNLLILYQQRHRVRVIMFVLYIFCS